MKTWLGMALIALLFPQQNTETRIIEYLKENIQPGKPVIVSDLTNKVFTTPEERAVLSSLYNTFFKIPLFLVQYNSSTGQIPSLKEISEQFNFTVEGTADVILRVMEVDPRVPRFFERNPRNGEITSIDIEPIRHHPQFGQLIERTIAGWEGQSIPQFQIEAYDGKPCRVRRSEWKTAHAIHLVYQLSPLY